MTTPATLTRSLVRPGWILAGFLCSVLIPGMVFAGSADLTRHLGDYVRTQGKPTPATTSFTASDGQGRVIVTRIDDAGPVTSAVVSINGTAILGPRDFKRRTSYRSTLSAFIGWPTPRRTCRQMLRH